MKLTKTLSAAIAATTIAGAVGFAVAQTTSTDTTTSPSSTTMQPQAPAANSTGMSTSTTPSDTTATGDLAPRADRN